jgi:hypothetical protein
MPCLGAEAAADATKTNAAAAPKRRAIVNNSGSIIATIPLIPVHVTDQPKEGFVTYQTFSLDKGDQLLITRALLDRFLACMKPASITLRPPCAGVFLGLLQGFCTS